jgi:hypothetical protein
MRRNATWLLLAAPAALALTLGLWAQDKAQPSEAQPPGDAKIAPYFPTPQTIVDKMLQLGELKAGEKMYDLGSGDGRIVIKILGLESRARIVHGDLLQQDYSSYDLLTIYLLPVAIQKITPIFEKQLKKGARIVAHDFEFPQWTAAKVIDIDDDGEGRSHRLYLYRR